MRGVPMQRLCRQTIGHEPLAASSRRAPRFRVEPSRWGLRLTLNLLVSKVFYMTLSAANAALLGIADEKKPIRTLSKAALRKEVEAMSDAMVEEQGLLNHSQAAILLDVSARRVSELVELGKLTRFDFLGRTYVSMREIRARREADVKAGRPRRNLLQCAVASVSAALKADAGQWEHGGFTEYAAKMRVKKREKAKRKK